MKSFAKTKIRHRPIKGFKMPVKKLLKTHNFTINQTFCRKLLRNVNKIKLFSIISLSKTAVKFIVRIYSFETMGRLFLFLHPLSFFFFLSFELFKSQYAFSIKYFYVLKLVFLQDVLFNFLSICTKQSWINFLFCI